MADTRPTIVVEVLGVTLGGDAKSVVINKGEADGISEGQRFLIYQLSAESITDPTTGDDLGKLEIVRGTGIVSHLQEKLATITSDMTRLRRARSGGFRGLTISPPDYEEEDVYFKSVKRGDLVKAVP